MSSSNRRHFVLEHRNNRRRFVRAPKSAFIMISGPENNSDEESEEASTVRVNGQSSTVAAEATLSPPQISARIDQTSTVAAEAALPQPEIPARTDYKSLMERMDKLQLEMKSSAKAIASRNTVVNSVREKVAVSLVQAKDIKLRAELLSAGYKVQDEKCEDLKEPLSKDVGEGKVRESVKEEVADFWKVIVGDRGVGGREDGEGEDVKGEDESGEGGDGGVGGGEDGEGEDGKGGDDSGEGGDGGDGNGQVDVMDLEDVIPIMLKVCAQM